MLCASHSLIDAYLLLRRYSTAESIGESCLARHISLVIPTRAMPSDYRSGSETRVTLSDTDSRSEYVWFQQLCIGGSLRSLKTTCAVPQRNKKRDRAHDQAIRQLILPLCTILVGACISKSRTPTQRAWLPAVLPRIRLGKRGWPDSSKSVTQLVNSTQRLVGEPDRVRDGAVNGSCIN